jgi:hypothetical protein
MLKAAPELLRRVTINEQITVHYTDEVAMALRKADAAPRNERIGSPLRRTVAIPTKARKSSRSAR